MPLFDLIIIICLFVFVLTCCGRADVVARVKAIGSETPACGVDLINFWPKIYQQFMHTRQTFCTRRLRHNTRWREASLMFLTFGLSLETREWANRVTQEYRAWRNN